MRREPARPSPRLLAGALVLASLCAAATIWALAGRSNARPAPIAAAPASSSAPAATVADSAAVSAIARPRERESSKARRLAEAAAAQVGRTTGYDGSYAQIRYPGGDVPLSTGVCSDVVVRAFRKVGVDLQVEVHEDMAEAFSAYPKRWGLTRPDPNIDHRRVPNLQTYFRRKGAARKITSHGSDYWPGDVVTWSLSGLPHIGIVSRSPAPDGTRFLVTHNVGAGTQTEGSSPWR